MKKQFLFVAPLLLSSIALGGCGKTAKTELKFGQMVGTEVTYIDYQSLKEKMDGDETFLLTVYAQSCSCWSTFHTVLNQYIDKAHVYVYAINYKAFHDDSGASLDNFGLNIESGYTSFAIVNKGELVQNLKSGSEKLFNTYDAFSSYISDLVTLPKMFYVSLSEVDQLYASNETSVLYFARSSCGDCQYLDKNFLNSYEPNGNLYILDCETIGIRQYDDEGNLTPESAEAWAEFKVNYGLASANNATYGYNSGYVPTLFLLKGNSETSKPTFLSGACYFNDSVSSDDNGYYISSSYYTDERKANLQYLANVETPVLMNKRLDKEDVVSFAYGGSTYYFWDQSKAAIYHDPLVKAFLDYALPQVTHTGFEI